MARSLAVLLSLASYRRNESKISPDTPRHGFCQTTSRNKHFNLKQFCDETRQNQVIVIWFMVLSFQYNGCGIIKYYCTIDKCRKFQCSVLKKNNFQFAVIQQTLNLCLKYYIITSFLHWKQMTNWLHNVAKTIGCRC